jgi:hypothetical protein
VVLLDQKAGRAASLISRLRPEARVFLSPHPSPLFINDSPGNRDRIQTVFMPLFFWESFSLGVWMASQA